MNQYELEQLLEKYLSGTCTPDEEAMARTWASAQPDYVLPLAAPEKQEVEKRLWRQIKATTQPAPVWATWRNPVVWAVAAAASIVLMWVSGTWPTHHASVRKTAQTPAAVSDLAMLNTSNVPQLLKLSDGSVVRLQPGAKLSYPARFRGLTRCVYLTGEARFDVRRDPNHPFTVQTGDLTTEVLGTSFVIRSPERGRAIEVAVLSGKVSVYENSNPAANRRNGILLTPNQRATFDRATRQLVPSVVENPVMVRQPDPKTVEFVFTETPLPAVLAELSAVYALEIIADSNHLKQCTFTGDLNNLSLFDQLELVCRTLNARYEVRGTHVFISGEGCQ
jgi:transmembrane sensor